MSSSNSVGVCYYDNTFGPTIDPRCRTFDFTLLFEQAFFSLVPSLLLALTAPIRIAQLFKRKVTTVPNLFSGAKIIFTLCYACTQVALVAVWALPTTPRTTLSIPAAVLSFIASVFVCFLSDLEHRKSVQPSVLLNVYLFFSLLFDVIQARTLWFIGNVDTVAAIFSISLAWKFMLLIMEAMEKSAVLALPYRSTTKEATSSIYNRSVFWWLNRLLLLGFQKVLTPTDLDDLDSDLRSASLALKARESWARVDKTKKYSLLRVALTFRRTAILVPVLPRLALVGLKYAQPFLLTRLVKFVGNTSEVQRNDGYGLIGATAVIYIGLAVANGRYRHNLYRSITMMRAALISLIYTTTLDSRTQHTHSRQAKPVTLMSADVDAICNVLDRLHELWACPLEVAVAIYLLATHVGAACIICVFFATASALMNTLWVGKEMSKARKTWNEAIQRRIALTTSVLSDMKSVKMLGISRRLQALTQNERIAEVEKMGGFRLYTVAMNLIASINSTYSAPFLLMVYALKSNTHARSNLAADAFVIWSLLDLMSGPLASLLAGLPSIMSSLSCFARIEEYLLSVEQNSDDKAAIVKHNNRSGSDQGIAMVPLQTSDAKNGRFAVITDKWSAGYAASKSAISNISTSLPSESLTIIIGPVGSGKTSFLLGLIGELPCESGSVSLSTSSIGYCQQTPWLSNDTIENIVKGPAASLDEEWYQTVIYACALDTDIDKFPDGNQTLIGSRGVTLSGGQRQRLALARTVYARRSILLLDDIFSALDAETEHFVFTRLFSKDGLLRRHRTTVILATHAAHLLPAADYVIALGEEGTIIEEGPPLALLGQKGYAYSLKFDEAARRPEANDTEPKTVETSAKTETPAQAVPQSARQIGDWSAYSYWARHIGWARLSLFLFLQLLQATFYKVPQIWIQFWADHSVGNAIFISLLFVFAVIKNIAQASGTWLFLVKIIPRTGERMHARLLRTIMAAPLSYHSSTDSGISLNRFSQDMTVIDNNLALAALALFFLLFLDLWSFGYIIYGTYYLAAFLPLIGGVLYLLQKFYLRTSRQIRFLDLEMKSPLFTHFTETFEGLTTIRVFKWQEKYTNRLFERLDASQRAVYLLYCIQRWLNFCLDTFVAILAILLVTFATEFKSYSSGAAIGIAMLNVLSLSTALTQTIQAWTSLETSIGAIARIKQLEDEVKPEGGFTSETLVSSLTRPFSGAIRFENITVAYDSKIVLQDFDLMIQSGEKIGICGRTGSGKSTLLSILFRLVPVREGRVCIGDTDIATLPLEALRSSLIVLPQEPFILMSGDIRFNLAPQSAQYNSGSVVTPQDVSNAVHRSGMDNSRIPTDNELISTLKAVDLWSELSSQRPTSAGNSDSVSVDECAEILSTPLSKLGLSHGQRQLLCLARAILRKNQVSPSSSDSSSSRILVLDEPTSSLDTLTDRKIRQIIKREFWADYTVLMVAHRASSLEDCDRVIQIEGGRII